MPSMDLTVPSSSSYLLTYWNGATVDST